MQRYMFPAFLLVLLGFMAVMMLGPSLPDSQQRQHCVYNIHLPGPFGFSLNCDSFLFIQMAHDPGQLLEKNNVRQDRPGFILLAASLSNLFTTIYPPAKDKNLANQAIFVGRIQGRDIYFPVLLLAHYFAYITINIIIVLFSFFFLLKISCSRKKCALPVLGVGLLLIFNDVVKAFIWSPHTQMFNILLPLFCLWCFIEVMEHELFDRPAIFGLSFLAGLGVTMYGSFYLYLPSILVPALVLLWQNKTSPALLSRFIAKTVIVILLVTLPAWLWVQYVEITTGSFYSNSTELYHHAVWMKDAWQQGLFVLIGKLAENFRQLAVMAGEQGWIIILLLLPFLSIRGADSRQWQSLFSVQLAGSVFISGMFLFFFAMVGLITPRVAYTAIPPLIALVAHTAQQHNKKSSDFIIAVTVIGYGLFELLKTGPFS